MLGWLFTWSLTIAAVCYGWINPFFGLMVYWSFAILRPPSLWHWSLGQSGARFSQMVGIAVLVGWLFKGMGQWSNFRAIRWPMLGLGLYLLAGVIARLVSPLGSGAANHMDDALTMQAKIVLMAVVTITLVREASHIRIFGMVIAASMGYLAYNFNVQYLENPHYLLLSGFGGVDNNGVGMIMVMGVPLCFFLGINDRRLWAKGLYFFAAACMVHVVLFSYSRGAMLGLGMIGAVLFWVALVSLPRKMLTLGLGVLFALITLRLAGEGVRGEFASIFVGRDSLDASAASRFETWSAAWRCTMDHPLGVGPRGFNLVAHQYGLMRNKSVHNLFLQTSADCGLLGMLGLALFFFGSAWSTFNMTRSPVARRLGWPIYYGHMVCVALAGYLVASQFIGVEQVEHSYIIAVLGLCVVAYVDRVAEGKAATRRASVPELEQVPEPGEEPMPALNRT